MHHLHRTSCEHLPHGLAQDPTPVSSLRTHHLGVAIAEGTLHVIRPLQHALMQSLVEQSPASQQRTKIAQKKMANTALTHM